MFCPNCGQQIADGAAYCPACGQAQQVAQQPDPNAYAQQGYAQQPDPNAYAQQGYTQPNAYAQPAASAMPYDCPHPGYVNFGVAIKNVFVKAFDFKTRASKSEFWWGYLFLSIISSVGSFIPIINYLSAVAIAYLTVPLMIRRFHDVGMPWQQAFKVLIPIYGIIFMIQTCLLPSVGDNPHGRGPQAPTYQAPTYYQ